MQEKCLMKCERDLVMWTLMFAGYAQSGKPRLGLDMFREMMSFSLELGWVVVVSFFFFFFLSIRMVEAWNKCSWVVF